MHWKIRLMCIIWLELWYKYICHLGKHWLSSCIFCTSYIWSRPLWTLTIDAVLTFAPKRKSKIWGIVLNWIPTLRALQSFLSTINLVVGTKANGATKSIKSVHALRSSLLLFLDRCCGTFRLLIYLLVDVDKMFPL